jgi:hypothetical protein
VQRDDVEDGEGGVVVSLEHAVKPVKVLHIASDWHSDHRPISSWGDDATDPGIWNVAWLLQDSGRFSIFMNVQQPTKLSSIPARSKFEILLTVNMPPFHSPCISSISSNHPPH